MTTPAAGPDYPMDETDPLVADYLQAKQFRDHAQEHFAELEQRLIKQMEADQRKSHKWRSGGVEHTLTYVQGHVTDIDEVGLRKALGARNFDRYTKKVLERRALEKALDFGEVDKVTVARFISQRPKKAYLSYTEKEVER